jgi:hypothetical protein
MPFGDQYVAVAAAGHQAVLDLRGRLQVLNQEKTTDKEQKDDHDRRQTGGLPFLCLFLRPVPRPMAICYQEPSCWKVFVLYA